MIAITGFLHGVAHVLSGPDHIVALTPLAVREAGRARYLGFMWGLGHGFGSILIGGIFVSFGLSENSKFFPWSEVVVGFTLMCLGAWGLRKVFNRSVPSKSVPSLSLNAPIFTAFGVGTLHGLAGVSHLLLAVPALALTRAQAVIYLVAYFLAALFVMFFFGMILEKVSQKANYRFMRNLMLSASLLTFAVGLIWVFQKWPTI